MTTDALTKSLRLRGKIAVWNGKPSGFLKSAVTANQSAIPPTRAASVTNKKPSATTLPGNVILMPTAARKHSAAQSKVVSALFHLSKSFHDLSEVQEFKKNAALTGCKVTLPQSKVVSAVFHLSKNFTTFQKQYGKVLQRIFRFVKCCEIAFVSPNSNLL